ncbi:MAG TPA: M50 family metallopeptidase [Acetivibrio sp.]|uniref:M50 family metallopeptidase n=1 Tax=Acetivibrio sp. TaxID=1872092 RepID=UPI002BFF899B|nr:M50 family metallopeptidase [Acetivibrio sp.]HOM01264.1 M50 family metallopeptidase [Acetivibrio sp.]
MKTIGKYLAILIAVVLLWNQIMLKPFRILSVFFHKMGHAFMAFLFGYGSNAFGAAFGSMGDSMVSAEGWFPSFMISNGGYFGSILFFVLIMFFKRTNAKKYLPGSLAIIYLFVSISVPALRGTVLYAAVFTAIAILLYMIQRDAIEEIVIDVVAMSSIAYIIYETLVETLLFKINQRFSIIKGWNVSIALDIARLRNITGLPELLWAIVWIAISVLVLNAVVLKMTRTGKRRN